MSRTVIARKHDILHSNSDQKTPARTCVDMCRQQHRPLREVAMLRSASPARAHEVDENLAFRLQACWLDEVMIVLYVLRLWTRDADLIKLVDQAARLLDGGVVLPSLPLWPWTRNARLVQLVRARQVEGNLVVVSLAFRLQASKSRQKTVNRKAVAVLLTVRP